MDSKKYLIYTNRKYDFSLKIPSWWKKHCFLRAVKDPTLDDAEYVLTFNLRYTKPIKGKHSCEIFSIIVFNICEEEWKEKFEDSPVSFLAAQQGKVFATLRPEEPPEEFFNEKTGDYNRDILEFRWLSHMENVEIDQILRSFKFTSH